MSRTRIIASVCAVALALTACGSDSDSADAGPYIDALEADFQGGGGPEGDESRCLAEAVVDAVGADTLEDAGITPLEFADAESLADLDVEIDADQVRDDLDAALADCRLGTAFADLLLSEFPAPIEGDDRACIVDALDASDTLSPSLAAAFVEGGELGEEFEAALAQSFAECPQVMGNLLADSIAAQGVEVDDEARACIIDQVEAGGPELVNAIVEGGPAGDQFGEDLQTTCLPDAAG